MFDTIAGHWPASAHDKSYDDSRRIAREYLDSVNIAATAFGHFGILVTDMGLARAWLTANVDPTWAETQAVWGAAFGCHIVSHVGNGIEIELIQPVEQSFLLDALEQHGPRLHHVAFYVDSIESTVQCFQDAAADILDPDLRNGAHGRVAFVSAADIHPLAVEVCEHYPVDRSQGVS